MKVRIDLLDVSERRQQGPVTTRFAVRALLWTLAASSALAGAWLAYTSLQARSEILIQEATWRDVEPRVTAARKMRLRDADAQAFLGELDAWAEIRRPLHGVLDQTQRIVPQEMQFIRMEIRDDIAARRPASEEEAARPYRQFRIRIHGRAAGERSEDTVSRFIQALKDVGSPAPVCPLVSLVSMQTDPFSGSGFSTFEIYAEGAERPLRAATAKTATKTP